MLNLLKDAIVLAYSISFSYRQGRIQKVLASGLLHSPSSDSEGMDSCSDSSDNGVLETDNGSDSSGNSLLRLFVVTDSFLKK